MKGKQWFLKPVLAMAIAIAGLAVSQSAAAQPSPDVSDNTILSAQKTNETTVELTLSNQKTMLLDFYGENIFRLFRDDSGKAPRTPEAKPQAEILVENPRRTVSKLDVETVGNKVIIGTSAIQVVFDQETALFQIANLKTGDVVVHALEPIVLDAKKTTLALQEDSDEYFFGGGVQNGRFSHKGRLVSIENQNSWTDGGVASPTPFYWSTKGYGMMWHTFKKGRYDFGASQKGKVELYHESDYLDLFFMINYEPVALLNDFYQLTGNPVLIPKFGFYQGHLNAYNRDYWAEDENGILFEDGKKYKESQKDNGGVRESLNGELDNYQFSARAVVDRYLDNDMPLGWVLPNDGYGAGYGQTDSLVGNIANLKSFGDYARSRGVEIGMWTQSDLHPIDTISALLQRDIVSEVRDAGVRVLKTDVAWVGPGYSFGLHGIADAGGIMTEYGDDARPFIITLDGWAGTQRYAGVWTGDQTGGLWEYIRFHIPTYIGSGLSGQPNITSDMDGIFGGKKPVINIRDFQWKTFSPMELNMDGWGSNPKYPQALGEVATSINRNYLKLKSEMLPYQYSVAREAVDGLPMIRAMFLEEPNAYTLGKSTQYQYLYGPYFLVAPIYQETKVDDEGNDIRNNIYLPQGLWVDYLTGEQYQGGRIINSFDAPIWKLPVFVKRGAIIPMTNPNNTPLEIDKTVRTYDIYPYGNSQFVDYDDDGTTEQYRLGKYATTKITSSVDSRNRVEIVVNPAQGEFDGMVSQKATVLKVNVTQMPKKITARIGKKKVQLTQANSLDELYAGENMYYYNEKPNMNRFSTPGSDFESVEIVKNPELVVKIQNTDITRNAVSLSFANFAFEPYDRLTRHFGPLSAPANITTDEDGITAYTITPKWDAVTNADYYEITFDNQLYTTIKDSELLFEDLLAETDYDFAVRAVNRSGSSDWSYFSAKTLADPLQFAIKGITGTTTVEDQGGSQISKLFDRDEGNMWHTKWGTAVSDFDIIIDLHSINQLDKIEYLPRADGGNGILLKGSVYYSHNNQDWIEAGNFEWERNGETKVFEFADKPSAGYVKVHIEKGVGDFGSGREMYVFKVPGTESYLPGDINHDKMIDRNDLTSYLNYTGLRQGDADFEGYVSNGDINKNGWIDAYDISIVATQLDGGVDKDAKIEPVSGSLVFEPSKQSYAKDEIVEITVRGDSLVSVNALSLALPYRDQDYEYVGIDASGLKNMENFTNDRLHSNGDKVLYPTFINVGNQEAIDGSGVLFVIKLKAKRDVSFNLVPEKIMMVDKNLYYVMQ